GVVIGKKGTGIDSLKADVQALTKAEVFLNIIEVRKPEADAQLVADTITQQLEKRMSWRRVLKKALASGIKAGVRGIKIQVGGRLDGAEIARSEWYTEKSVPLHTLRADIDYATSEALTTYGLLGVKVWIYKGDILPSKKKEEAGRAKS
ncbi:MAG: 30S ribosomal protein S3, partial [Bdellovibrionales bacterium]|nr:30S ribosomal protein S3 [Bdellovibrionales bacterium]